MACETSSLGSHWVTLHVVSSATLAYTATGYQDSAAVAAATAPGGQFGQQQVSQVGYGQVTAAQPAAGYGALPPDPATGTFMPPPGSMPPPPAAGMPPPPAGGIPPPPTAGMPPPPAAGMPPPGQPFPPPGPPGGNFGPPPGPPGGNFGPPGGFGPPPRGFGGPPGRGGGFRGRGGRGWVSLFQLMLAVLLTELVHVLCATPCQGDMAEQF